MLLGLNETDQAITAAIARAATRYHASPARYRHYARVKYRLDPCYRALCARVPEGSLVVDLGCGLGMLGLALNELGGGRRCFGIDWDRDKLAAGQLALAALAKAGPRANQAGPRANQAVTLQQGDLRNFALPECDVVTLVDVLHYYDATTQDAVLARAVAALRPDGQLLLRETDPDRQGGARLTRLFERAMVRFGWNRAPLVHYRPIRDLTASLEALGLETSQIEVAGTTHPGNVLLSGRKRRPL